MRDMNPKVLYEDDYFLVIDKPAGVVVNRAESVKEETVQDWVKKLMNFTNPANLADGENEDFMARDGIVHRLDKETSGLLVIAKNNTTHLALARQFAKHSIKRKYIALVKGKMEFDEDIIELPIGRHPRRRKNMAVGFAKGTKYAKTHYRTLKRKEDCSLLELEPFTGRTHQLRVHLAFIGHPILGDAKYGKGNGSKRMCLHAKYIGFLHPSSGKFVEFSSDTPSEFKI